MLSSEGSEVTGVAECEGATVRSEEPVPAAVRRDDPDDRHGGRYPEPRERPVVVGVAECERAAVGSDQPVTLAVRGRCDPDDRLGRRYPEPRERPVVVGVAECERAAVGSDQPVAPPSEVGAMPTIGLAGVTPSPGSDP